MSADLFSRSMDRNIEERLHNHGIRPTAVRIMILRMLDAESNPVSSQQIETILDTVDRSTITRALSLFVEKGLVHIIDDGSGAAKYESCPSVGRHTHEDMHVHFHCRNCGKTFCLHSTSIPDVPIPSGFSTETANFILTGLCPSCTKH